MTTLKLAMIGCGAVAERGHLPAARRLEDVSVEIAVDRDLTRAELVAKKFSIPRTSADYRSIIGAVDAAIVALPHNLHASVCGELLRAGIHVLVEKPLALTAAECDELRAAAEAGKAILAVGLMRRFLLGARFAKAALAGGLLGRLQSFNFAEGNVYNWPVSSPSFLRPETAGGGVLFDTGAHTVDLAQWWLGDLAVLRYADDSFGGVEADCELKLRTADGVEGSVDLSRTRAMRNTAIIKGERGTLEVDLRKNQVSLTIDDVTQSIRLGGSGQSGSAVDEANQDFVNLFYLQLEDFARAIRTGTPPRCTADEAQHSVALIETCYAQRERLDLPWLRAGKTASTSPLAGKTVLVTGGTGFIGGRLVERLILDHGANVRVLARSYSKALRLARFPLEITLGDVTDSEAVTAAATGCDTVFHCAYDFGGSPTHKTAVSVDGTKNVCDAVLAQSVRRLVHLSTFSVYGNANGNVDEATSRDADDAYGKAKLDAEALVERAIKERSLPAVILQPTIVYGPFSRPWTLNPVAQLTTGTVLLPDDGSGLCNAVYIDDVVDAMIRASLSDAALGETLLISGDQPVTWRSFYGAYEGILGRASTAALPDDLRPSGRPEQAVQFKTQKPRGVIGELLAVAKDPYVKKRIGSIPAIHSFAVRLREKRPGLYGRLVSRFFGANPAAASVAAPQKSDQQIYIPDRTRYDLLTSSAIVRIDKARRLLGYEPAYDLHRGMGVTAEFLRWANLIPPGGTS